MALTETAHQLIREHFAGANLSNTVAVDATCGNGHDTVFLAQLNFKTVLAFDVQTIALEITQERLEEKNISNTTLILDGHQNLSQHLKSEIECVMFNLGYMPNSDKSLTTTAQNTITAISTALENLSKTGIISVICYPGHKEGKRETKAIHKWLKRVDDKFLTIKIESSHPSPQAPVLYILLHYHGAYAPSHDGPALL